MIPSAKAWEAVRHALGRLFSRASVYEVPAEQILPQATVHCSNALMPQVLAPGASEHLWRACAAVQPSSLTQIEAFVTSKGSCPETIVASKSHVVSLPNCCVMPVFCTSKLQIKQEGCLGAVQIVSLPDSFIALPADPLRLMSASVLSLPKIAALGSFFLAKPKGNPLLIPRQSPARLGPARIGKIVLSRVPLLRWGLQAPVGIPLSVLFFAEHLLLAETAGLPLSDVTLLGVYPAIPIIAVRRLVVEDEGRQLRLWLKPESWWGRPAPPRMTLLIGRQASTGKMLQAAG